MDRKELCGLAQTVEERLADRANVVGTGVGRRYAGGKATDEECIQVFVTHKVALHDLEVEDILPREIGGICVDVVEVGGEFVAEPTGAPLPPSTGFNMGRAAVELRKQLKRGSDPSEPIPRGLLEDILDAICGDAGPDPTGKYRPVPPGVSCGHINVTAGTVGLWVKRVDPETGEEQPFLLSNNHVIANSNVGEPGDQIVQPGNYDGGRVPEDYVGVLAEYVEIPWTHQGNAEVDAAIATIAEQNIEREILGIGLPEGVLSADDIVPELEVRKSGRTTGVTEGKIRSIGATVRVNYGNGRQARFVDQILIGPGIFSDGGDSGSGVLAGNHYVGLLFAGSSQFTVANPMPTVLEKLNVELL